MDGGTVNREYGPIENFYSGSLQQSAALALEGFRVCYIDGAWKEEDMFTGQGWFCRKSGSADVMMGAMNLRRSLSPLHAEFEALIWEMECMKTLQFFDVVFATDCSQLVKMVSTPDEWPAFSTHIEEFNRSKTFFPHFWIRQSKKYLGGQACTRCEEFSFSFALCRFNPTGLAC